VGAASRLSAAPSLTPIEPEVGSTLPDVENLSAAIDFRYSPLSWQTAYCFPDDHYKSLVGEHGDLRTVGGMDRISGGAVDLNAPDIGDVLDAEECQLPHRHVTNASDLMHFATPAGAMPT